MALPRFRLHRPETLEEALDCLAGGGESAAVLAGGTDLLVAMKKGLKKPGVLVSLQRVPGLAGIIEKDGSVVIGPLVTMTMLSRSKLIRSRLPVLADGARSIAAPLIRNTATVGGNLCNARPCADTAPPLMALGAKAVLTSAKGSREVALDAMIKAPGETVLDSGEILTAIRVPLPEGLSGGAYHKMIRRRALEITIAGVASQVALEKPGGPVKAARIFAASVAPVPLRLSAAERCVIGKPLTAETLEAAADAASKGVKPIDDLRSEAWYRRKVSGVLTKRTLTEAARRAGEEGP